MMHGIDLELSDTGEQDLWKTVFSGAVFDTAEA